MKKVIIGDCELYLGDCLERISDALKVKPQNGKLEL